MFFYKKSVVWTILVLVAIFFTSSLSFAQESKDNSYKERFLKRTVEEQKLIVERHLTTLNQTIGVKDLANLLGPYPYKGIGITFKMDQKALMPGDESFDMVSYVSGVWKNSPAERAKIKPGSRLISINGNALFPISFSFNDTDEQLRKKADEIEAQYVKVHELFQEASDSFVIQTEHEGTVFYHSVEKVLIGREVREFIDKNLQRFTDHLKSLQEPAKKLAYKVKNAGNNSEELYYVNGEILSLLDAAKEPQKEISAFKNALITFPENKQ